MVKDYDKIEYKKTELLDILKSNFDAELIDQFKYLLPYENEGNKIDLVNGVIAMVESIVAMDQAMYPTWNTEFILEWSTYIVDQTIV